MRRVDTFIASNALLDLLESPPLHPISHSSAKRAKPSQEGQCAKPSQEDPFFNNLVVDSSFLQAVDTSFMEDEYADFDLSGLVFEQAASSRSVSPLMLGPSLLANDLYTPSTQEVVARDSSTVIPLAQAGKLTAAMRPSKSLKRTARPDDEKLHWQSQLSEALRRSDAWTKSLVGSAATGEPHAVIDVLVRLSPRQVDALRPAAVRDLVQVRLSQVRGQMLHHFESRVAPSVLAMARESWTTRADENR
jgi:hypothetical protein